jgi:8-oxo-dGTP pyrophosphatase MutT (NUDIX family)
MLTIMIKSMRVENEVHLKKEEFLLTEAKWDDNTQWKFIVSKKNPDPNLCTAAFCVTSHNGGLLLVNNRKRGWEIPGGHIDEGEEIEQALLREVMEESGAVIENPQMFGYKIVLPVSPIPHRDKKGSFYPFPHSYVPYYFAEALEILDLKLAPDVVSNKVVNFNDAKRMLAPGHNHDKILEYLIKSGSININE